MSTIKSSDEHLTLNADGTAKEIKLQANGVEKAKVTSTGFDVTGTVTADGLYVGVGEDIGVNSGNKIDIDASSNIKFTGGGSERMRIDSSGNVGIGTSTSFGKVSINSNGAPATSGNMSTGLTVHNGTGGTALNLGTYDAGGYNYIQSGYVNNASIGRDLAFFTGNTERMRIDSDGAIKAGNLNEKLGSGTNFVSLSGNGYAALRVRRGSDTGNAVLFYGSSSSSSAVGSIDVSSSSTSYNTSSDYRLKENVEPMTGSIDRLKELKPSRFNFIVDADTTVDGFLAHEVSDIVPEAITGEKDAMTTEEYEVEPAVEATYDDDGNELTPAVEAVMGEREVPDYQGIDQAKLVPLLTSALQEAVAKIEALEARVEALENA